MNLALYRGIAVPSAAADDVIADIKARGLRGDEGSSNFVVPDVRQVRDDVDRLFAQASLDKDEIFRDAALPGVCACGGRLGAEFYAAQHNLHRGNDHPIVIEFEAPLDRIYVDPRDFLCTVFQLWDAESDQRRATVAATLEELFGPSVLRYFDSACEVSDQTYRIAMCNLASFDTDVVLAHYANRHVIGGRYGTLFESAFFVQGPTQADWILDLYTVSELRMLTPHVTLQGLL